MYNRFSAFAKKMWEAGETDLSIILDRFYKQELKLICDSSDAMLRRALVEEFFKRITRPKVRAA